MRPQYRSRRRASGSVRLDTMLQPTLAAASGPRRTPLRACPPELDDLRDQRQHEVHRDASTSRGALAVRTARRRSSRSSTSGRVTRSSVRVHRALAGNVANSEQAERPGCPSPSRALLDRRAAAPAAAARSGSAADVGCSIAGRASSVPAGTKRPARPRARGRWRPSPNQNAAEIRRVSGDEPRDRIAETDAGRRVTDSSAITDARRVRWAGGRARRHRQRHQREPQPLDRPARDEHGQDAGEAASMPPSVDDAEAGEHRRAGAARRRGGRSAATRPRRRAASRSATTARRSGSRAGRARSSGSAARRAC